MKGIILAGGSGTRLLPMSSIVCKQLLPIYDKPLICYPLSTLMLLGIREILIISTPEDTPRIEKYLGDGSHLGISLQYKVQDKPKGIAEAFILGANFIGNDSVSLILGDNILYMTDLIKHLKPCVDNTTGATVLAYHVNDPHRFGVVEFDQNQQAISLEEKPKNPKSNYAVIGLYFYDNQVAEMVKNLKPSARGELEITDLNKVYLQNKQLKVKLLTRGTAWLDAGTPETMLDSSNFVGMIEQRQGLKIACLEEIAFRKGYIDEVGLESIIEKFSGNSAYKSYLENIPKIV